MVLCVKPQWLIWMCLIGSVGLSLLICVLLGPLFTFILVPSHTSQSSFKFFCCITATVEVKFDSETVQYPHGRFSLHAPGVVI